jgi:hypothetical protein
VASVTIEENVSDCRKYTDDWRVAACAAGLKQKSLITKATFASLLDHAKHLGLEKGPMYTSIGFVTGGTWQLMVGHQRQPHFSWHMSLPVDPRNAYTSVAHLDHHRAVDKPVLLFLVSKIDGIPELQVNLPSRMHPSGDPTSGMLRVYRYGPIETQLSDGCDAFGKWEYHDSARRMIGQAIVMPGSMWCPVAAKSSFHVLHGEYRMDTTPGAINANTLVPVWVSAIDEGHSMNEIGRASVFL